MANNETMTHQEFSLRTQITIFIVSVLGTALASATTIVADFAIRLDSLSVCGGVLLVVGGLIASSFAANLGICTCSRREQIWTLILTLLATMLAVLTGISLSQWDRAMRVFSMAIFGWYAGWEVSKRFFFAERKCEVLSGLRQGLAMCFVLLGTLIYVIAPSLEIVVE